MSASAVELHPGGFLLCRPRLKAPDQPTQDLFTRWIKLHFRDLVSDVPAITHALRYTGPDSVINTEGFFNIIQMNDVADLQEKLYLEGSRQLDLEKTRKLHEGEEPVGVEGSVFEICDADFAVFRQVQNYDAQKPHTQSYQDSPIPTSNSLLIQTTFHPDSGPDPSAFPTVNEAFYSLCAALDTPDAPFKTFSSLYKNTSAVDQPPLHPLIKEAGEWSIVTLLRPKEESVDRAQVEKLVNGALTSEKFQKIKPRVQFWDPDLWHWKEASGDSVTFKAAVVEKE